MNPGMKQLLTENLTQRLEHEVKEASRGVR